MYIVPARYLRGRQRVDDVWYVQRLGLCADVSSWDVSQVTDMRYMFQSASALMPTSLVGRQPGHDDVWYVSKRLGL